MVIELLVFGWQLIAGEPQASPPPATPPAAEQSADQTQATQTASNAGERVCRRTNRANSRIPARVCRTREEWEAEEQRSANWMRDAQRAGGFGNAPPTQ